MTKHLSDRGSGPKDRRSLNAIATDARDDANCRLDAFVDFPIRRNGTSVLDGVNV